MVWPGQEGDVSFPDRRRGRYHDGGVAAIYLLTWASHVASLKRDEVLVYSPEEATASVPEEDILGSAAHHTTVVVGHLVYNYLLDMTSSGDVRSSAPSETVAMVMVVLRAQELEVLGVLVWEVDRCDNGEDSAMADEREACYPRRRTYQSLGSCDVEERDPLVWAEVVGREATRTANGFPFSGDGHSRNLSDSTLGDIGVGDWPHGTWIFETNFLPAWEVSTAPRLEVVHGRKKAETWTSQRAWPVCANSTIRRDLLASLIASAKRTCRAFLEGCPSRICIGQDNGRYIPT